MRQSWSVLCRRALTDQGTQLVTLLEVVEGFTAPEGAGEGTLAIEADFVTSWERDHFGAGERHNARLTLLDPNGNEIGEPLIYVVDLENSFRARNTTRFPGFPIRGIGYHTIRLEKENASGDGWELVDRYTVPIVTVSAVAQAAMQEGASGIG